MFIESLIFRAVMVEYENGNIKLLSAKDVAQREIVAKRLLTPEKSDETFRGVKRVCTKNFLEGIFLFFTL